jgi:NRPS condensation-like uncharacterized protein
VKDSRAIQGQIMVYKGLTSNQNAIRKLSALERVFFNRPAHPLLAVKIDGRISDQAIKLALKKILIKYPILRTRFQLDNEGNVWLMQTDLPELPTTILDVTDDQQWITIAEKDVRRVFNYETGPMIRFTLLRNDDKTILMLTYHHCLGDGLSLFYMLSDLFSFVAEPKKEIGEISDPKLCSDQVVPFKSTGNLVLKAGIRYYNHRWKNNGTIFSLQDYKRLIEIQMDTFGCHIRLATTQLLNDEIEALNAKCKQNKVTINTALTTAMIAADSKPKKRYRIVVPVNIRDRYTVKAGKTFGLFNRGSNIDYDYNKKVDFWENARKVQIIINKKIADKELNKNSTEQIMRFMSPSLVDSIFFSIYSNFDNPVSKSLIRISNFSHNVGVPIITNLGRIDIPTSYGDLKIDSICAYYFMPNFEKIISIVTINNKLTISLTYNEQMLSSNDATQFLKKLTSYLKQ